MNKLINVGCKTSKKSSFQFVHIKMVGCLGLRVSLKIIF